MSPHLNMKLSKNFTYEELIKSQTATRLGIDNEAHDVATIENLKYLCENVLQHVRDEFGPTIINSGYRSPSLNDAIGGSKTSQHSKGEAADIEIPGCSNLEVAEFIRDNLEFDQLILEGYKSGVPSSGWVHVSIRRDGDNRKQVLTASFKNGVASYSQGLSE